MNNNVKVLYLWIAFKVNVSIYIMEGLYIIQEGRIIGFTNKTPNFIPVTKELSRDIVCVFEIIYVIPYIIIYSS